MHKGPATAHGEEGGGRREEGGERIKFNK